MLQECNKFREHQAREVLIDLLEKQLARRESLVKELEVCVDEADRLLLLPPRET
jgi:MED7 protein